MGSASEITIPDRSRGDRPLSRMTVLPGLIDAHTHLGSRADRYDEINKFKDTPNHSAFAAVLNARKTLEAGFTTVRDVGSGPFLACRPARLDRRGVPGRPSDRRQRAGDLDHRRAWRLEQRFAAQGPGADVPRGARLQDRRRNRPGPPRRPGPGEARGRRHQGERLGRRPLPRRCPRRPAIFRRGDQASWSKRPTPPAGRSPPTPTGPRGSRTR